MYFIECDHVKNLFNLMVFLTLKTQSFALEKLNNNNENHKVYHKRQLTSFKRNFFYMDAL